MSTSTLTIGAATLLASLLSVAGLVRLRSRKRARHLRTRFETLNARSGAAPGLYESLPRRIIALDPANKQLTWLDHSQSPEIETCVPLNGIASVALNTESNPQGLIARVLIVLGKKQGVDSYQLCFFDERADSLLSSLDAYKTACRWKRRIGNCLSERQPDSSHDFVL